ncbi:MAG TPA: universal stress protein [Halomonas sp.]|nr:universal stress protein [Halomonas sp.]
MYKTILVPIDGSDHAEKALAVAAHLARGSGATLHLLTVSEYPPDGMGMFIGGISAPITEAERKRLSEEANAAALKLIDRARGVVNLDDIEVKEVVRAGLPAERITSEAKALGVDAIIMGSRGLGNIRGMVFGSVSQKVSHTAKCSVITVT